MIVSRPQIIPFCKPVTRVAFRYTRRICLHELRATNGALQGYAELSAAIRPLADRLIQAPLMYGQMAYRLDARKQVHHLRRRAALSDGIADARMDNPKQVAAQVDIRGDSI